MPHMSVILLQVFLKFEPEYCVNELKRLARALGERAKPVMHDKRHIGFVVTTRETPQQLVDRLERVLEVDNFTDYTAIPVLGNPAGKHGGLNSLVTRVKLAYAAIQSGPANHLKKSQTLIEQRLGKNASGKMRIEPPRNR